MDMIAMRPLQRVLIKMLPPGTPDVPKLESGDAQVSGRGWGGVVWVGVIHWVGG
jgi:hypothetical protein